MEGCTHRPAATGSGGARFIILNWLLCGRSRLAAQPMSESGREARPVELIVPVFSEPFAAIDEADFEQ